MSDGYVYILINPALKGQVKIGMTTNSPDQRAAELSTTGVPHHFVVVYAERVRDCERVERLLHERLAEVRVTPNREFFRMTPQAAVRTVLEVAEPFRIAETSDGDAKPYMTQARTHFPDANDVHDQQTQAKLQQEKRIRRILLKRERAKAQSQGGQ